MKRSRRYPVETIQASRFDTMTHPFTAIVFTCWEMILLDPSTTLLSSFEKLNAEDSFSVWLLSLATLEGNKWQ